MEIYLRDLAEQQTTFHQVTVLVHNHDFKTLISPTMIETINKVKVIRQKTLKPILFTPIMLGVKKKVSQLINQKQVDIIHISWPNPSALFLLFNKRAKKIPWVIQWQSDMVTKNSSWLLKLAYQFFKPFEKKMLNHASKIIASTEEYFNYSNVLQKFKPKCEFIALGLTSQGNNTDNKTIQWAHSLWKNAQYKIYNVGRLTFYKNQQLLIQAAELLPNSMFIITGTGTLEQNLKQQILNKKLTNITLTGSLNKNKLNALMETCDAFCLPSNDRAESYGMVLLEALYFNKKILVSNLPGSGMKWIASQTSLGTIFDCNNAKDLVEKIKDNISTYDKTNNNKNMKQFSIEYCANNIDKVYQSLINA